MKKFKCLFLIMCCVVTCLFLSNLILVPSGYCEEEAKFTYHQKPIKKVKEKNVKVRVAVSRFDEKVDIEGSPYNLEDENKKNGNNALVEINDSDVKITIDEKEEKEVSKEEFLTGLIANALQETELFEVVERREINAVIREINFQNSKWVKSDGANALGNIYDVQYVVAGDILRNKNGEKIGKNYYTVALRMYNVNTAGIVSSSVISSSYLKEAVNKAVTELSKQIKEKPWTCRIVGKSDEGIYINAGLKDDLEKRDVFYVYRVEGEIVDPETSEILGLKRKKIALIEIQKVLEAKLSLVKIVEVYDEIKVGDTVSADRIDEDKQSEMELWKKIYKKGNISSDKLSKYSLTSDSSSPENIMANFGKAVVKISTGTAMGSGFIIDVEGHILTNFHVVQGATAISAEMIEGNQSFSVQVVKVDPIKDMALLKINNANVLSTVVLGDSDILSVGERVVAIGNPQGLENTISDGLVSGIRESEGIRLIQTSVPVTHGSSGGPLFNMQGEVVGIITAGIEEAGNLNFAVPINYAKDELLN